MSIAKKTGLVFATASLAAGASAGAAVADAGAQGHTAHSPGVGSGNLLQIPVHVPINFSGNTGTLIGGLNPAFGNTAVND
ncbi:chaplin [Streptomyces sp. O3]